MTTRTMIGIAAILLALIWWARKGLSVDAIMQAIGVVESAGSGGYQAIGPPSKGGDRAYGKYQVMGANIGPWAQEAIGRIVSIDDWLNDPALQDTVVRAKLQQYWNRYGTIEDVASMWFSGKPFSASSAGLADSTGTTVANYVQRVKDALERV